MTGSIGKRFTSKWLYELIERATTDRAEKELVEFKSEWYDIDNGPEKAKFLKAMLALGNTVSGGRVGYLIFGVDDPELGATVRGSSAFLQPEKVAQVLASHTRPPVRHDFHRIAVGSLTVDVLEVIFATGGPHYATKDLPGLRGDVAYIRRGATIGTMTPDELEAMYREKLGLASKGQYQGMVYQMVTDNQAGWAFPMASPEP